MNSLPTQILAFQEWKLGFITNKQAPFNFCCQVTTVLLHCVIARISFLSAIPSNPRRQPSKKKTFLRPIKSFQTKFWALVSLVLSMVVYIEPLVMWLLSRYVKKMGFYHFWIGWAGWGLWSKKVSRQSFGLWSVWFIDWSLIHLLVQIQLWRFLNIFLEYFFNWQSMIILLLYHLQVSYLEGFYSVLKTNPFMIHTTYSRWYVRKTIIDCQVKSLLKIY